MTRDMLYLQCCPTDTRQREEVKSIWRILLFLFLSAIKNKKKPPVFALLRASFFLSTWTCYFFSPTGIIAYADQEINMQVILKHSETNKKLLFRPLQGALVKMTNFNFFIDVSKALLWIMRKSFFLWWITFHPKRLYR